MRAFRRCLGLLSVAALLLAAPSAEAACYRWPFDNPRFGDPFGATEGRSTPHRGFDFPMSSGTGILTISNGTVVENGWSSCLGWYLVVAHADGWYSGYGHMLEQSPMGAGTNLRIGDALGRVGNTGSCSQGAHLHLTLGDHESSWCCGTTVDPYAFIASRGASPEDCNNQDDDCDGGVDEDGACESWTAEEQAPAYAPPTTTDVNGDGAADLCAFESDGLRCRTASAAGWATPWEAVPWRADAGWDTPARTSTVRMGDLNGDGRADACARGVDAVVCALSTGTGFAPPTAWRAGFPAEDGWDEAAQYSTIRLADVTGDARDDLCARDAEGFACWASTGSAFGRRIEGPAWSDDAGFDEVRYYGTLRMGDIDGDARADVCIRGSAALQCWLSDGVGFPTAVAGPRWSDAGGWGDVKYWSTFRLADVNGDGRADACARSSVSFDCALSTGRGFEPQSLAVAGLADSSGWSDLSNYATLRAGDVDGDGLDDLCARANARVVCWVWDGATFVPRDGPAWSDDSGWGRGRYYNTMRLTDFDGDGRDDLCARAGAGWRCHASDGVGFGAEVTTDALADASGANEPEVWGTILSGGRSCGVAGAAPCPESFPDETALATSEGAADAELPGVLGGGGCGWGALDPASEDEEDAATIEGLGTTAPLSGCAAAGGRAGGRGLVVGGVFAAMLVVRRGGRRRHG